MSNPDDPTRIALLAYPEGSPNPAKLRQQLEKEGVEVDNLLDKSSTAGVLVRMLESVRREVDRVVIVINPLQLSGIGENHEGARANIAKTLTLVFDSRDRFRDRIKWVVLNGHSAADLVEPLWEANERGEFAGIFELPVRASIVKDAVLKALGDEGEV